MRKLLSILAIGVILLGACATPSTLTTPAETTTQTTPPEAETPDPTPPTPSPPAAPVTTPTPATQTLGLPDLVWIKMPIIEPLAPIVGNKLHIKQTWRNAGSAATSSHFQISLQIKRGELSVFEQYIEVQQPVKPGEERTIDITSEYVIHEPGLYRIVLALDSEGAIAESREDNNVAGSDVAEIPDLSKEPKFSTEPDTEALAQAKMDIEKYRKGDVTLTVVDAQGQPCSGLAVEYAQTEHSFLFGIFCRSNDGGVWSLMREAGLNYGPVLLDWGRVEEGRGTYDLGAERTRFLRQFGFAGMGHSLIWLCTEYIVIPEYVFTLSCEELKDAFYHHIYKVVENYKGEIKIWNVMNEPMMTQENLLGLSEQETIAVIREGSQAIRDADPEARIMINVWPPGGENRYPSQKRGIYPYAFLRDTIESGVDFDIIGLECYYNAYVRETLDRHPRRSLSSMGELIDKYSTLGKNIQITEISVPSEAIGEGYWGQPWSQELQAEYLKAAYTIFFGKPQVEAITWWNATDKPLRSHPFIYHGGLLDEENQPKKSYHALKDLIKSWTTTGQGLTDGKGQITFRGFGGIYQVVTTDPKTGLSKKQEITVEEQKHNLITIVFD